jgi:gas vesicle protein
MASNRREDRYEEENPSKLAPFLWGVLTGGLVGAAFALLYAPKPGSETRRDLRFRLEDVTESINDLIAKTMGDVPDYGNESRERGARVVDDARSRANDLMSDADRTIAEARRRASTPPQESNTGTELPPEAKNDAL